MKRQKITGKFLAVLLSIAMLCSSFGINNNGVYAEDGGQNTESTETKTVTSESADIPSESVQSGSAITSVQEQQSIVTGLTAGPNPVHSSSGKWDEEKQEWVVIIDATKIYKTGVYLKIDTETENAAETVKVTSVDGETEYTIKDYTSNEEVTGDTAFQSLKTGVVIPELFANSANLTGHEFILNIGGVAHKIHIKKTAAPQQVKIGIDDSAQKVVKATDNIYDFKICSDGASVKITVIPPSLIRKLVDVKINGETVALNGIGSTVSIALSDLEFSDGVATIPMELNAKTDTPDFIPPEYEIRLTLDYDGISFAKNQDGSDEYRLTPEFSPEVTDYALSVPDTYDSIYLRAAAKDNKTVSASYGEVSNKAISNNYKYQELGSCIAADGNGQTIIVKIGEKLYNVTVSREPSLDGIKVTAGDDKEIKLDKAFSKTEKQYYAFVPENAETVKITGEYGSGAYSLKINGKQVDGKSENVTVKWDDKDRMEIPVEVMLGENSGQYTVTLLKGDSNDPVIISTENFSDEVKTYNKSDISAGNTEELAVTVTVPDGGTLSYQWEITYKSSNGTADFTKISSAESDKYKPQTNRIGDLIYRCKITNTVNDKTYVIYSPEQKVFVDAEKAEAPKFRNQFVAQKVMKGSTANAIDASAGVDDGGNVTYQWYVSNTESADGGKLIEDATDEQYIPETTKEGVCYYYCVATNTVQKYTESSVSDVAKVEVLDAKTVLNDKGITGDGTEKTPFEITSEEDFNIIRECVKENCTFAGSHFKMTKDVTLSSAWTPIGELKEGETASGANGSDTYLAGTSMLPFSGILDGGGNTITYATGGKPLFGYVREATVKNLKIYGEGINAYGLVNNYAVDYGVDGNYDTGVPATIDIENVTLLKGSSTLKSGLIGGYASGRNYVNISNSQIQAGVIIGYNKDQNKIGSFAGEFNGNVTNCTSAATVYGVNAVGGLIGCKGQSMGPCNILNSSFSGTVVASGNRAGGIIASGYDAKSAPNTPVVSIQNCYASADITGNDEVGGILGSEPVCENAWANGSGSITDNHFCGTINAIGENVGGIIGFLKSYDKYQGIGNNYYIENCGATKGIGKVEHVIYTTDDKYGSYGIEEGSFDPDKVCAAESESAFRDGTVVAALNSSDSSMKNWTQGDSYPVFGDKVVAYKLEVSGEYKTEYYVGQKLDLDGIILTVSLSDGSKQNVNPDEVTISGYDRNQRGQQTVTLSYGAASTTIAVTVLKNPAGADEITVKFTLLGDAAHGDAETVHTLKGNNLTSWIAEDEYTVDVNATVKDVLEAALLKHNMTCVNSSGNYVQSITNGTVTLAEFTNGSASGWMYTLNGIHSNLGVSEQYLEDGDVIIFHYTDDYTQEDSIVAENPKDAAEKVSKLIAALPAVNDLTLLDSEAVAEASNAYNALSDEAKSFITEAEKSKLDRAVLKIAELKKKEQAAYSDMYKDTGKSLKNLAEEYGLTVNSVGGEWSVLGLARSETISDSISNQYYKTVVNYVKDKGKAKLDDSKSTDNSRVILALTSAGKDVTDVSGYNLLEPLADFDYLKIQGINGPIWALIALDSHKYEIPQIKTNGTQTTRDLLVQYILDEQLEDGGWVLSGSSADVDITAMAIQSLAPYYEKNSSVKAAVDRALSTLSGLQAADGSFSSWGTSNSESISQVIVALTSLGIDPSADSRFVKNGYSMLDALAAFYNGDGTFKHTLTAPISSNGMATEQAYYALASYYRLIEGKTSLYDMNDVKIMSSEERIAEVQDLIDNLPDKITLDDKDAVNTALSAYNNLSAAEKAKVGTSRVKKLNDAVKTISDLEVKNVEDLIAAIGKVTLDKEDEIAKANAAYNALSEEQQKQVSNYDVLKAAIEKLAALKSDSTGTTTNTASGTTRSVTKSANVKLTGDLTEAAQNVIDMIDAIVESKLPDDAAEYTEEQIDAILEAYRAYNDLTAEEQLAVEKSDNFEAYSDICLKLGECYHYDEPTGTDMRDNTNDVLSWYIKLVVKPQVVEDQQQEDLKGALGDESELFTLSDIYFINMLDGSTWYPESALKVKIPMVDIGSYKSAVIVHFTDDGKIELIEGKVVGDEIEFYASDFSLYGIAGSMQSLDDLLVAQDAAVIWPWLLLAALALIAIIILVYRKKRKKEEAVTDISDLEL